MKPVVVYTDPFWALEDGVVNPALADVEREVFGDRAELRFGVVENGAYVKSGKRFIDNLAGASALAVYRAQMTEEVYAAIRGEVKVIGRQGVGYDNIGVPFLEPNGIFGFNVPDYCVDEVSTHTMSLVLALERHVCLQNDHLKNGRWDIYDGGYPRRLQGLTAGIIGLGRIGKSTAQKIRNFYGQVIGYDPYVHGDQMIGYGVRKRHSLKEFLAEADVVILHCLLNDDTKDLAGEAFLAGMKSDALLVNTARGGLVDPKAVHDALAAGRIAGYASDVFSPEDPNEHEWNRKLLPFENVIVTSHRAFLSAESELSQRRRVAEEILHVLETGLPPRWGNLTG
ncbi:3-phosphoglycerate dehydrogenase [Lentzea aerocolonigenes]|uniref:3-phosphoglycerate dehydrogenase n=1 Tax=Lentzea aerocolonigenes TaxID=68170 RepID=A0A0F0HBI2_LENAE|nr:C-terminal binding protein [Lentzea aerocolonigenes]KJK51697.1 3-phosphoglycerate dehydrogenase [Lentzea aerocolonigenes]